jgi:RHS repeat-associated protein
MVMPNRNGGEGYRYGFQGQEVDKEIKGAGNSVNYKYRMHDPRVGRFFAVDPLADHPNQIGMSPYSAMWNNPILYTDPDGQCPFCPWLDAVVDIGFVLYDVGEIIYDYSTTGEVDPISVAALAADGASILVPMTVGAGLAVRAAAKTAKTIDKAADVSRAANKSADAKKTYQTYTKQAKNPADGTYSGRTSGTNSPRKNVENRDKSHHMNDTHKPAKIDQSSTNSDAIRGREQQLINKNGGAQSTGGTSGNKINGVGAKNKKAGQYQKAAKKEFGGD